ncbi:MAG: hypothetical protein ACREBG_02320 [Pyrinomonadaceae bacterium]
MILVKTSDIKFRFMFVVLLFACLLEGCSRIPPEYRPFLVLSPDQRHAEMQKLPIEKRIDYYLAGVRYLHPPQIGLADDMAKEGKQAIPVLLDRLKREKDEMTKFDIMYIFKVMHGSYYGLKDETEAIAQLKQTTNGMRDPSWKSRSEELLKFIVDNQSPDVEKVLDEMKQSQERDN